MADDERSELAGSSMQRWDDLLSRLEGLGGLTVAFSGGVDSRFLVHAALHVGVPVRLVHVSGPHVAPADTSFALAWAQGRGVAVRVLELDPLGLSAVAAGDKDRCYACKRFLFEQIRDVAEGVLCDGSNASDSGQFRPGMRALHELGIVSPLAGAGLSKDMIRALGQATGLERPEQQSRACLLTRLPYGMSPQRELLVKLAEGERVVEGVLQLAGHGETPFRLRVDQHGRCELHVALASISPRLTDLLGNALHEVGFSPVPILCMSNISGYFDRTQPS